MDECKIRVDISEGTNHSGKTYRWSGTKYAVISETLALGEVTGTAYDGGKGDGKYDADFCLFMENWITKKNMLQTGKLSKEKFDSWKSDMLAYYKDSRLDNEADSKNE